MSSEFDTKESENRKERFLPRNLRRSEMNVISQLLGGGKYRKIVVLLSRRDRMYLNEIHNAAGGSKTATIEVLKFLEKKKVVIGNWEMKQISSNGGPKKRAVKTFSLNGQIRELLDNYMPLLEHGLLM